MVIATCFMLVLQPFSAKTPGCLAINKKIHEEGTLDKR